MQPGVGVREEEVGQECRLEELRKIRGSQGMGNAGEREGGGKRLGEGVAKSSISVRTMAGGGRGGGSLLNRHSLGRLPLLLTGSPLNLKRN